MAVINPIVVMPWVCVEWDTEWSWRSLPYICLHITQKHRFPFLIHGCETVSSQPTVGLYFMRNSRSEVFFPVKTEIAIQSIFKVQLPEMSIRASTG